MGAIAGGIYVNTESGLTPTIDRLTAMLDKDSQQRDQLAGLAPALAATGINVPKPQSFLERMLGGVGIGSGAAPAPQQPAAAALPAQSAAPSAYRGPAPGFDNAVTRTLGFEGGLNPKDTNGTPSNYGINAAAHPGVDVANLTPDQAKGIYRKEYWDGIGADSMPPALSRAAFDTAVIAGPGKAKELLAASGGDPMKFMDLRQQFQNGLIQSDPQKYGPYAKAWTSRNNGLRMDIAALTAGVGSAPAGATAFAPQGGGAPAPASQAIAQVAPGTNAGAEVAAAGLRARTAAGYGPPPGAPAGAAIGAQTAAMTGAAPMPIATSSHPVGPSMQPSAPNTSGGLTGSMPAGASADSNIRPTLQTGAGPTPPGEISKEALGQMISNPASRQLGLQLWQQMLGKQDYGFMATPGGDIIRTDQRSGQAQLVFRAPVKHEVKDLNGRLVDYDPQSSATRDVTPAGLPQGYRPATPQEQQAWHVPEGTPLFVGPTGKPETLNGGNQTTINNAVEPLQKAAGDRFDRSLQAADGAAKSIPAIRIARQQLNAGIYAGALSGDALGLQKLANALGFPVDTNKITNTETFNAAIGPIVLQTVKGLGSGAGITDADRAFAERMAGSAKLDEPSIARLLDIQERAAQATISQHNMLVDQIMQSPAGAAAYKNIGPAMRVAVPPAAASAASATKTIGGQTYTKGPDGKWYVGQ